MWYRRAMVRQLWPAAALVWAGACHARTQGPGALRVTPFVPRAGCAATTTRVPPVRATDTLSAPAQPGRVDAQRAYVARRIPGGYAAGPFAVPPSQRAILFLRDTSLKTAALSALAALSGPNESVRYALDSVEARKTDWDAAELYDWLAHVGTPEAARAGLTGWGVTVDHRISLSVATTESLPTLRAHLEALGVPCGLVVLWVSGPVRLAAARGAPPNNTLHPAGAPVGTAPHPAPWRWGRLAPPVA